MIYKCMQEVPVQKSNPKQQQLMLMSKSKKTDDYSLPVPYLKQVLVFLE